MSKKERVASGFVTPQQVEVKRLAGKDKMVLQCCSFAVLQSKESVQCCSQKRVSLRRLEFRGGTTRLLQQATLMDNGVLDRIEATPVKTKFGLTPDSTSTI